MKKGKRIVAALIIGVLFLTSCGAYVTINRIYNEQRDQYNNIDYDHMIRYSDNLISPIYVIADNLMKSEGITSYDLFADTNIELSEADKKVVNGEFSQWYNDLSNEANIKYQAINKENNKTLNNVKDNLFSLMNDKKQKKYNLFIRVDFDSEGKLKFSVPVDDVVKRETIEKNYIESFDEFRKTIFMDKFYYDEDGYELSVEDKYGEKIQISLKNPKNISMVIAVPNKLNESGFLYHESYYGFDPLMQGKIAPILLFVSIVIFVFTLFIPMQYLKEIAVLKNLIRIKLAILVPLGVLTGTGLFISLISLTYKGTIESFADFMKKSNLEAMTGLLTFIITAAVIMAFLFLIMLLAFVIKTIFDKGLKRFMKENTLIGWLFIKFGNITNRIVTFDFKDSTNKAVLKIVALNFIVVSIICCFFVYGWFFTIIYSIVLFVILRNKFNSIKYDYEVLLRATRKLSNGEFDIEIREDVGVFNSLRDEFSNIKDGFEKAVKEEVKSQRMKTELISNVSHDLKTPLTSIITYVDLLKNDELSDEQRKEYIETIDRNSLRLKNLIDDLFEVSKVNSGNVKLNLMDVDIVSLIKQAYFENVDKMQEKNLEFKMNFSDEKIIYHLDSSKTYRIFENLLVNISKYALRNTRVYIDVQSLENQVVITFKNISENEINIDENELTERFVQGDASRNTGGSGLGLAIAKSFTELQGGNFKIDVDGDLFKAIVTFKK